MKMRRLGAWLAAVFASMTLVVSFGCKEREATKVEPAPAAEAERSEKAPDPAPKPVGVATESTAYADATGSIGNLIRQEPLDWGKIDLEYEVVRPLIARIDLANATTYASEIKGALDGIKKGERVDVNQHVVTKSLQHVSVLRLSELMDKAVTGKAEDAGDTVLEIRAMVKSIDFVFKRRDDTVYGKDPTLAPQAEAILNRMEAAKDRAAMAGVIMDFSTLLSKTYALSVLFEMKGVEEFCRGPNANPDKCEVKRTEARIYYRIIAKSVENKDPKAHTAMVKMIDSEHGVPSYEKARDLLSSTLPFTAEDLTF